MAASQSAADQVNNILLIDELRNADRQAHAAVSLGRPGRLYGGGGSSRNASPPRRLVSPLHSPTRARPIATAGTGDVPYEATAGGGIGGFGGGGGSPAAACFSPMGRPSPRMVAQSAMMTAPPVPRPQADGGAGGAGGAGGVGGGGVGCAPPPPLETPQTASFTPQSGGSGLVSGTCGGVPVSGTCCGGAGTGGAAGGVLHITINSAEAGGLAASAPPTTAARTAHHPTPMRTMAFDAAARTHPTPMSAGRAPRAVAFEMMGEHDGGGANGHHGSMLQPTGGGMLPFSDATLDTRPAGTPEGDFGWLRSDSHSLRLQLLRMKYGKPASAAR